MCLTRQPGSDVIENGYLSVDAIETGRYPEVVLLLFEVVVSRGFRHEPLAARLHNDL